MELSIQVVSQDSTCKGRYVSINFGYHVCPEGAIHQPIKSVKKPDIRDKQGFCMFVL